MLLFKRVRLRSNDLRKLRRPFVAFSLMLLASCGYEDPGQQGSSSVSGQQGHFSVSLSTSNNLGLTATQKLPLSATTDDPAGVTWSITPIGGSFSSAMSLNGQQVTFTAPTSPGLYKITATSVSGSQTAATATVAVTDLAGVYTYHNDVARTGANAKEYLLTPANVNANAFGKLFSCVVDGAIYAQPLWVANLTVEGTQHNVIVLATGHDSVIALDADDPACVQIWSASLVDAAHGANTGESAVLSAGPNSLVAGGGVLVPETGVVGTPVIDPATQTLYVVSKSVDSSGASFYQRLHAIDLATGAEKPGSPVTISATYPGTGDGGTTVTFNPKTELQRAGLALVNNTVVITWASHGDAPPYYGWIIGYTYDGKSFSQADVLNVAPNAGYGGIWMTGAAPAVDETGNVYLVTGNGTFDANNVGPLAHNDYGDSLLQLSEQLTVSQYFTPSDQDLGVSEDLDFGTGGPVLINLPMSSPVTHMVIAGGKDGNMRVLNRDALGGYGDSNALQQFAIGAIMFTPAFWNNKLFVSSTALQAYTLDPSTAIFSLDSSAALSYNPESVFVSAETASNGIVWTLNAPACTIFGTTTKLGAPTELVAYDASNVENELWNSSVNPTDEAGQGLAFAAPIVANGKVYVGTHGSGDAACSLTSNTGELDVYGLK